MATLLRDTAVHQAKPKERKYHVGDGDNLRLMIHPNGSKYWCVRYRLGHNSTDKEARIGKDPDLAIAKARTERNRIRDLVATGIDPRKDFAKKPVNSPVMLAMGDSPIFRASGAGNGCGYYPARMAASLRTIIAKPRKVGLTCTSTHSLATCQLAK